MTLPFPSPLRGLPSLPGVEPLKYGLGAWSDHVSFAFDLVAALRPALLVELGTFSGESYFAFCQAAREARTGTRAYAVDTWEGDEHAGALDASAFAQVDAHNRERYAAFSQLIRGTFDSARPQFTDGSIDLLHIDGLHTYEAVRHDFENWRSAVRPGGVVLFHDTAARHADFGVWRLWEELSRGAPGRAFEFRHGYGLGVLRLAGPEPASPFLRALFGAGERAASDFREYYERAAADLRFRKTYPGAVSPPPDPTDRSGELAAPAARPFVGLQVFFPTPGGIPAGGSSPYREADSLTVQFRPGAWRRVVVPLPEDYDGGPLRLDPVNCFGLVDLAGIRVTSRALAGPALWVCRTRADLARLTVGGSARPVANPRALSLFSFGLDPVLLLPELDLAAAGAAGEPLQLEVWLRVRATWGDLADPVSAWLDAHEQRPALTTALAEAHAALDEATNFARTEREQALTVQAGEFERLRTELEAAHARNLEAAATDREATYAESETVREELDAARTERLLAATEAHVCRRDLARAQEQSAALTEQLAAETRARHEVQVGAAAVEAHLRRTLEAEVDAARVHARNLAAVGDRLRQQIESERAAAANEVRRWRETAAAAKRGRTQLEAERDQARIRAEELDRQRETERHRDREQAQAQADTSEQHRQELARERAELEERLRTVAGHLADTERAYRTELAQRRAVQASLLWKLGRPWRGTKRLLDGKADQG